jgi:hypothetical protein
MIAGSVRIALPASSPRSAAFLRTAASWASVLACLKLNPTTPGLVMGIKRSSGDLVWVVMMLPNGSAHPIPETYAGRRKKSSATFHQEAHWHACSPRRFVCFHHRSPGRPIFNDAPRGPCRPSMPTFSTRRGIDTTPTRPTPTPQSSVRLAFLVPQVRKELSEKRTTGLKDRGGRDEHNSGPVAQQGPPHKTRSAVVPSSSARPH